MFRKREITEIEKTRIIVKYLTDELIATDPLYADRVGMEPVAIDAKEYLRKMRVEQFRKLNLLNHVQKW